MEVVRWDYYTGGELLSSPRISACQGFEAAVEVGPEEAHTPLRSSNSNIGHSTTFW